MTHSGASNRHGRVILSTLSWIVAAIAQARDVTGVINYSNVGSGRHTRIVGSGASPSFARRINDMTSRFLNVSINVRDRAHVCCPALHRIPAAHNVCISNIKWEFLRCTLRKQMQFSVAAHGIEIELKPWNYFISMPRREKHRLFHKVIYFASQCNTAIFYSSLRIKWINYVEKRNELARYARAVTFHLYRAANPCYVINE